MTRLPVQRPGSLATLMGVSNEAVEQVEVRAFRGPRQASVYQELVVTGSTFVRILVAAEQHRLPVLGSLDQYGPHELGKAHARDLAAEVTVLRSSGELTDVDDALTSLAELARWCAHAREGAWLRIQRA